MVFYHSSSLQRGLMSLVNKGILFLLFAMSINAIPALRVDDRAVAPLPNTAVLYSQDTFDYLNPDPNRVAQMLAAAKDINQSNFTTVILGQWHVWADGSIYYNNSPLTAALSNLKLVVPVLKAAGGTIQKVLVTFGGSFSDYPHLCDNQGAVQAAIVQLRAVGVDGVDWDIEDHYDSIRQKCLADLTNWGYSVGLTMTAAPYDGSQLPWWLDLLAMTKTSSGQSSFSWWGVQLYGGAYWPSWWGAIVNGLSNMPPSFLIPGFGVLIDAQTPAIMEQDVATAKNQTAGLVGAFIWQYEQILAAGYTAADYANAIYSGLS